MPIWDDSEVQSAANSVDVVRAVEPALLADAVAAAVGSGWLLSVGGSRDGFSVSLGVIVDGKSERKWHTTAETLERALHALVRAADSKVGETIEKTIAKAQKAAQRKA